MPPVPRVVLCARDLRRLTSRTLLMNECFHASYVPSSLHRTAIHTYANAMHLPWLSCVLLHPYLAPHRIYTRTGTLSSE